MSGLPNSEGGSSSNALDSRNPTVTEAPAATFIEGGIDEALEQNADKYNLTAINVKSILNHLLKDERVVSLFKSSESSNQTPLDEERVSEDIHNIYGPILTRSKARESAAAGNPMDPLSPIKALNKLPGTPRKKRRVTTKKTPDPVLPTPSVAVITNVVFPEDDPSDEEYQPDKLEQDSSEDEGDTTSLADTDTVSISSTPHDACLVSPSLSRPSRVFPSPPSVSSLGIPISALPPKKRVQRRLDMSAGQVPTLPSAVQIDEELISNRTRSKFSIDQTLEELDAAFRAPDYVPPPSLEDSHADMDEEDVRWRAWVHGLLHGAPPTAGGGADGGDPEEEDQDYNFLADQGSGLEEVEEYRNDKAVRIPEHEVSALIQELLGSYNEEEQTLTGVATPLLTPAASAVNEMDPMMSSSLHPVQKAKTYLDHDQLLQLHSQTQQYFQLLMQTFVMSRFEPSLVFVSQIVAKAIEELGSYSALTESGKGSAAWNVPDVQGGLQIVQAFNPYDTVTILNELQGVPKPPVSELSSTIMFNCPLFLRYKSLLPKMGYAPLTSTQLSKTLSFTPTEDNLLLIGMHRFGSTSWSDINEYLLPTKTITQLKNHVKNLCAHKTKANIIKSYKKTGKLVLAKIPEDKDLPQWYKLALEAQKSQQGTTTSLAPKPTSTDCLAGTAKQPTLSLPLEGTPLSAAGIPFEKTTLIEEQLSRLGLKLKLQASPRKMPPTSTQQYTVIQPKAIPSTSTDLAHTRGYHTPSPTKSALSDVVSSKVFRRNAGPKSSMRMQLRRGKKMIRGLTLSHSPDAGKRMTKVLSKAGVDVSDPQSRFLYNYMSQVKDELLDAPEVYDQFLRILMEADQNGSPPIDIFTKVEEVLKSWPHLVNIFSDFLRVHDAQKAKALKSKVTIGWGKAFLSKLETVFSSQPERMEQLMTVFDSADSDCPKDKLLSELTPLFDGHLDLLDEMVGYLSDRPPPPMADEEVFETVKLSDSCDVDELCAGYAEMVTMPPHPEEILASASSGSKDPSNKENTNTTTSKTSSAGICSTSKPSSKRTRAGGDSQASGGSHSQAKRRKIQTSAGVGTKLKDQHSGKGGTSSAAKTSTPNQPVAGSNSPPHVDSEGLSPVPPNPTTSGPDIQSEITVGEVDCDDSNEFIASNSAATWLDALNQEKSELGGTLSDLTRDEAIIDGSDAKSVSARMHESEGCDRGVANLQESTAGTSSGSANRMDREEWSAGVPVTEQGTAVLREWSKDDDKLILGSSLTTNGEFKFDEVAKQLGRTKQEIENRFRFLMEQYQRLLMMQKEQEASN